MLNIKLLVVKNHSEMTRTLLIDRDRRGVVTAADILHDESVEVINPDTPLLHLGQSAILSIQAGESDYKSLFPKG